MQIKKTAYLSGYFINGVHDRIRTCDRTLRRRVLYPAELRRQLLDNNTKNSMKRQEKDKKIESRFLIRFFDDINGSSFAFHIAFRGILSKD